MPSPAPASPAALRWRVAAVALLACGVADGYAVAVTASRPVVGWLLASAWLGAAGLCAWRAWSLRRAR
jgi:hypothetical protein